MTLSMDERVKRTEELIKQAKAKFEEYAGMDAPALPDDPISALQVTVARNMIKTLDSDFYVLMVGSVVNLATVPELNDLVNLLVGLFAVATQHRLDLGTLSKALIVPKAEQQDIKP